MLLSSEEILPGESGEIKTSYHTKSQVPKIKKWIKVYSNDNLNPMVRLSISGTVVGETGTGD